MRVAYVMKISDFSIVRIRKKQEVNFVFLCLFFSVFNDWLRIPTTPISLYRIVLLPMVVFCFFRLEGSRKYILYGILFLAINLVQNIIFVNISGMAPQPQLAAKYLFLYGSLFAVFLLVKWIRKTSRKDFQRLFFRFLPTIGILNIAFYLLCETPVKQLLHLANRNNYAISLAAIFPFFFLKGMESKKKYYLLCFAILLSLFIVGSKAAFLGVGLEIALILAMKILARVRGEYLVAIGVLASVFFTMVLIVRSPLVINGHPIAPDFSSMTTHILSRELYPSSADGVSNKSLHFRTNAVICMMSYIQESNGMGIGIGNTGRWLAVSMPHADYYLNQQSSPMEMKILSPHFALLEFISDCGIWAMVLLFAILKSALQKFFNAKRNDFVDFWFVAVTLSFPIWCMSASGIYTIYYLFILIACFYEWYQMKASGTVT